MFKSKIQGQEHLRGLDLKTGELYYDKDGDVFAYFGRGEGTYLYRARGGSPLAVADISDETYGPFRRFVGTLTLTQEA